MEKLIYLLNRNIKYSLFFLTLTGCVTSVNTNTFSDWDKNADGIDRREFINTFPYTNFFQKWDINNSSEIEKEEFFQNVFTVWDLDGNGAIGSNEYIKGTKAYYFNLYRGDFSNWDSDKNESISSEEFNSSIAKTNIISLWDLNSSGSINVREFAGGMFYIWDADNNLKVEKEEFNKWIPE